MLEDNTLEDSIAEELRAIKKSKVALTDVLKKLDVVANAFEKTSYLDARMTKQEDAIKDLQSVTEQCVTNKDLSFTVEGIYDEVDKRMKILFQEFSIQIVNILESKISYTDCHEKLKEKATWNSVNNLSQQITRIKLAIDKHIKNDFENFKLRVAEELESKIGRESQPIIKPKTPKTPGPDVDDLKLRVSALEERVREFMRANDSFDYEDEQISENEMMEDLERVVMREKRRGEVESPRRYQTEQFNKAPGTAGSSKESGESLRSDPSQQVSTHSIISTQPKVKENEAVNSEIASIHAAREVTTLRSAQVATPIVVEESSSSSREQSARNFEAVPAQATVSRDATLMITSTISSQEASNSEASMIPPQSESSSISFQPPANSFTSPASQIVSPTGDSSSAFSGKPFIIAPGPSAAVSEAISKQDTIQSQISNPMYTTNTNMSLSRNQSKSSMVSRNIPSRLSKTSSKEFQKRMILIQKELATIKNSNEELRNELNSIVNAMSNRDERIKTLEGLLETSFHKYEQLLSSTKKRLRIPEVENDAKKSIVETNKLIVEKVRKEFQSKFARLVNLESSYDIFVKGTTDFKSKTKKKLNEIIKAIEGLVKICTDLKKEMPDIKDNYDALKKKLESEMQEFDKQIKDIHDPIMDLISNQHRENEILHEELSRNSYVMRNIVDDYVQTLDVSTSLNKSLTDSIPSPRKDHSQLVYENLKLKQENARLRTQSASPTISLKNRFKNRTIRQATAQTRTDENWLASIPEGKKLNLPRVGRANTTISC